MEKQVKPKTPVQILMEMMLKKKLVPDFELINNPEGVSGVFFTYQVSCDGLVTTATGRSKKVAKQECAKQMLANIQDRDANVESVKAAKRPLPTEDVTPPKRPRMIIQTNAVGALITACAKKRLPKPNFEVVESGPGHCKTFTVVCIISPFEESATARGKKQAKQQAALKMLGRIDDDNFVKEVQLMRNEPPSGPEKIEFAPEQMQICPEIMQIKPETMQFQSEIISPMNMPLMNTTPQFVPHKVEPISGTSEKKEEENKNVENLQNVGSDEKMEIVDEQGLMTRNCQTIARKATKDNDSKIKVLEAVKDLQKRVQVQVTDLKNSQLTPETAKKVQKVVPVDVNAKNSTAVAPTVENKLPVGQKTPVTKVTKPTPDASSDESIKLSNVTENKLPAAQKTLVAKVIKQVQKVVPVDANAKNSTTVESSDENVKLSNVLENKLPAGQKTPAPNVIKQVQKVAPVDANPPVTSSDESVKLSNPVESKLPVGQKTPVAKVVTRQVQKIVQGNLNAKNSPTVTSSDESVKVSNAVGQKTPVGKVVTRQVQRVVQGNVKTDESAKLNTSVENKLPVVPKTPQAKVAKQLQKVVQGNVKTDESVNSNTAVENKLPAANQKSPVLRGLPKKMSNAQAALIQGYMKEHHDEETRCAVLKEIHVLAGHINSTSEITKKFVFELRQSVLKLLKPFKFHYKCMKLETKSTKCIMLIEISTNPDINEIGVADSLHLAELNGIKQILQVLTKLL